VSTVCMNSRHYIALCNPRKKVHVKKIKDSLCCLENGRWQGGTFIFSTLQSDTQGSRTPVFNPHTTPAVYTGTRYRPQPDICPLHITKPAIHQSLNSELHACTPFPKALTANVQDSRLICMLANKHCSLLHHSLPSVS
jgi:hypothetical protein